MAKIKINKLPKGFELKEGKIVETKVMKDGGDMYVTGDQADYGLVTTPQEFYGETNFNNTKDENVRYSLSSVPRDNANIEAEGGETVLTDLNNDGRFGLYDITGPRHSKGGVPMFLPEQSFIFSDTPKLKFTKEEMSEFDVGGSKKTPASLSKKFRLNDYYAELDSQYADNISSRSAELMLKKNMEDLSKLGFMQEAKKGFSDGVPLVSHPYLISEGIDPLKFTAQAEGITERQAMENAIQDLPADQQQQLVMLQRMLVDAEKQDQQVAQNQNNTPSVSPSQMQLVNANNAMMPMARFGNEMSDFLNKAQEGTETDTDSSTTIYVVNGQPVDRATYIDSVIRNNQHRDFDGNIKPGFVEGLSDAEIKMYGMNLMSIEDFDVFNQNDTSGDLSITDREFDLVFKDLNNTASVQVTNAAGKNVQNVQNVNQNSTSSDPFDPSKYFSKDSKEYKNIKEKQSQGFEFSITEDGRLRYFKPASSNFEGQQGNRTTSEITIIGSDDAGDPIYSDDERVVGDTINKSDIGYFDYGMYSDGNLPATQYSTGTQDSWYGADEYASDEAKNDWMRRNGKIAEKIEGFDYNKGKNDPQWLEFQKLYEEERKKFYEKVGLEYQPYFGSGRSASDFDGKAGGKVFNAPGFDIDYTASEEGFIDLPEEEKEEEEIIIPPIDKKEIPKRIYQQSLNNLTTLGRQKDNLYLPFDQDMPNQTIDYVLDDYTGRVGANIGSLNTIAQALGTAGGAQAIAGSNVFGKTLDANAKSIGDVNSRNVQSVNRIAPLQAQLDMNVDKFNIGLDQQFYDNTQTVLQNRDNFINQKNAKFNELFNNAMTQASNTYNLNSLYDYYNINPDEYGDIEFTDAGRQFYKTNQQDRVGAFYDRVIDYEKNVGTAMPEKTQQLLYNQMVLGSSPTGYQGTVGQNELSNRGIPPNPYTFVDSNQTDIDTSETGKRGKETGLKRYANHFYTGKMGV